MYWEPVAHHLARSWFRKKINTAISTVDIKAKSLILYFKDVTEMHSRQMCRSCAATSFQRRRASFVYCYPVFPLENHPFTCRQSLRFWGSGLHAWFRRSSDPGLSPWAHCIFRGHSGRLREGRVTPTEPMRWDEIFFGNSGKLSLAGKLKGCENQGRSGAPAERCPWPKQSQVLN